MIKNILNNSLSPSIIGFGGAPIGELFENLTENNCIKTLNQCFNHGINFFDTSPFYGYGLSEKRLGKFLKTKKRDSFIISTKVGRYLIPEKKENIDRGIFKGGLNFKPIVDYTYDGVMKSFYQSLERLNLNEIDICLIHDLDSFTHGDKTDEYFKTAMNGAYKALLYLKDRKLIKSIGVGLNDATMCTKFAKEGEFDFMMLANRYTLLEQTALNKFFPIAKERKIKVILAGVFNSGILIKGLNSKSTYEYRPVSDDIKNKYIKIENVSKKFKIPLAAAALQFSYAPDVVSNLVLGMDHPHQIKDNIDLMNLDIDRNFWKELISEGLIDCNSPIP